MKREEKSLIEFKQIMEDLVHLLRKSTGSQTVYMNWVNRSREQFVLETQSTSLPNVMFSDRVVFDQHFLDPYKDLSELKTLKVGHQISQEELRHYYDFVPVSHLLLIPFKNNGETVAITVLETEKPFMVQDHEESISAFRSALANVLNTYLELTDFYGQEQVWTEYENSLKAISPKHHKADILDRMAIEMQKLLPGGGVTVLLRGMEVWTTVFSTSKTDISPVPGLVMEEKSMSYDALQAGEPQFSIHFNQNPKRVSGDEQKTEGATLAVPIIINGRRHGVVLAYDKNPLTFKESTKHQITNLVRTAVLSIQVTSGRLPVDKDLFTSDYGNFIPDLWELALEKEISGAQDKKWMCHFGLLTIDNLQALRSKYRLEELKRIQRTLVKLLNPNLSGAHGFIGFNSDYVMTFLVYTKSEDAFREWVRNVKEKFESPVELSDGKQVKIDLKLGAVKADSSYEDVHDIISDAKKELSGVLNATG